MSLRRHHRAGAAGWAAALVVALVTVQLLLAVSPVRAATPPPSGDALVVLIDLSSSMATKDSGGTVKLEGAKTALADVLRQQRGGGEIGLWTYPGPEDDCSVGNWVGEEPPRRRQDENDRLGLIAQVRELTAQGNTPTAQALAAVAESLRDKGGGTVLLVSDGESNCNGAPCETAKELRAQGLDITVQAMGFQISAAGREELQCIAAATDGRYYDVADAPALAEEVAALTAPAMELDVEAPSSVPAGAAVELTATLKNPSQQMLPDVNLSLVFGGPTSQSLLLAAVPPRLRLGNIPAGGSRSYTWTLSTTGGSGGVADFTVSAWSSDVGVTRRSGGIQVTGRPFDIGDAGPVVAELSRHGPIAVVGDSYSSGEGAGAYNSAGSADFLCHRSDRNYRSTLFSASRTRLIACSGATTADLVSGQADRGAGFPSQQQQLLDLESSGEPPSAVLLTFGGNDVHFSDIVTRCFFGKITSPLPLPARDDCTRDEAFTAKVTEDLASLAPQLTKTYRDINNVVNSDSMVTARRGWRAPIFVLPYIQGLPDARRSNCAAQVQQTLVDLLRAQPEDFPLTDEAPGFSTAEIRWANALVDRLDRQVARAVADAAAGGVEAYYVAPVQDSALPGHTACDDVPYIVPLTIFAAYRDGLTDRATGVLGADGGLKNQFVHPNQAGHEAIASALVRWSQQAERVTPSPAAVGDQAAENRIREPVTTITLQGGEASTDVRLRAGDEIVVRVLDMEPGSSVWISVHSVARQLGTLDVAADGTARGVVSIPLDLPAGRHTLEASGFGSDGAFTTISRPIQLRPVRPTWFWVAAGVTLLGLLLAGGSGVRELRRRRSRPVAPEPVEGAAP